MAADEDLALLYQRKRDTLMRNGAFSTSNLEDAFHQRTGGTYIGDFIFGANDGIVTTFAVVTGSVGANLSSNVILILGFANLIADGLSMGLGNYLGKKSELEYLQGQRRKVEWEIDHHPELEKNEVELALARYGFDGDDLNRAVGIVTSNRDSWADFMMTEELGIHDRPSGTPERHGVATFAAFAVAGFAPLTPFVLGVAGTAGFAISTFCSAVTLFTAGAMRAVTSPRRWWLAGLEVLVVGAVAAVAAYFVGDIIEHLLK